MVLSCVMLPFWYQQKLSGTQAPAFFLRSSHLPFFFAGGKLSFLSLKSREILLAELCHGCIGVGAEKLSVNTTALQVAVNRWLLLSGLRDSGKVLPI